MATEKKELSADDKFELMVAALAAKPSGLTKDDLAEILGANAQQLRKAMKPENDASPNVSIYHPGGGPQDALPFDCFWNGFPVHKAIETHHDRELELLRQVQPGEYTVICKDGMLLPVTVSAERDALGKVTKLDVRFSVSRETKPMIPPMFVLLYQLVHSGLPQHRFVEAMREHLSMMFPTEAVGA